MAGIYSKFIRPIYFAGDIVLVNLSFLFSYIILYGSLDQFIPNHYFSLLIFYNAAWIIITTVLSAYKIYRVQTAVSLLNNIARILLFYFAAIIIFKKALNVFYYPRSFSLTSYLAISTFVPLWRIAAIYALKLYRKKGFNYRRVVIVGLDNASKELELFFNVHPEHGYKLYKTFNINSYPVGFVQLLEDLKTYCLENDIDEIYCSYFLLKLEQINDITDFANQNLIRMKFLPDAMGFTLKQFKIDFYDYIPVFILKPSPLDENVNNILKRSFDIIFSFSVIVFLLSWLMPLIALLIKINSKGPIFFKQKRSGLNNNDFWCWKFRTMKVNIEADEKQASKSDPRITKIGSILRKTSLDELPQFINVLLGNMSVVGPRPHMLKHTKEYSEIIDKYMVRHFIKPGITGLAQIKGLRGETTDSSKMEKRVKMDIFYMENWSFLLDIKIILQTVWIAFIRDPNAA